MNYHGKICFPFTAIVGMENAKLALLVNAVNPLIGGVVLAGDKGTGKSTLVRAFAQILPEQLVAKGCPFACNPHNPLEMCDYHYELWSKGEKIEYVSRKIRVIDLPLNATPDRVVGSIDIEQTIKTGKVAFKPGLLAEANRQILYIDEVNLLEDYIADLILDATASGWNVVERESISFKHPSKFVLVGSMNPEEGMLRPQILDRFGLYIPVEASMNPEERAEIVERVDEFARDPISFYKKWETYEKEIGERIVKAKEMVGNVTIDRDLLKLVTTTVVKLEIKTHRAEIVTVRTAKAIAALDGRTHVNLNDIVKAMELALRHRFKSKPFEEPRRKFDEIIKEFIGEKYEQERGEGDDRGSKDDVNNMQDHGVSGVMGSGRSDKTEAHLKNFNETTIDVTKESFNNLRTWNNTLSKGSRDFKLTAIASFKGIPIDAIPPVKQQLIDVDLPTSLRTSVASNPTLPIVISPPCIRVRVRKEKVPVLHTILLDTSGSMLIQRKISIAKHILKSFIEDAYIKRMYISLIVFRGLNATIVTEPTRNMEAVYRSLEEIPVGGSTPFTPALLIALNRFKTFKNIFKNSKLILHIISDGNANVFLTTNPKKEILDLAEEYKILNVEVIAYHTALRSMRVAPAYLKLFIEAVGGKYYEL
jgi:magnesium chelatase subunit D